MEAFREAERCLELIEQKCNGHHYPQIFLSILQESKQVKTELRWDNFIKAAQLLEEILTKLEFMMDVWTKRHDTRHKLLEETIQAFITAFDTVYRDDRMLVDYEEDEY